MRKWVLRIVSFYLPDTFILILQCSHMPADLLFAKLQYNIRLVPSAMLIGGVYHMYTIRGYSYTLRHYVIFLTHFLHARLVAMHFCKRYNGNCAKLK